MTSKPSEEHISVWYKEPWPWFIIGVLVITFIWGFFQVSVALSKGDSIVKDNYYKAGRAINADLARDKNAGDINLTADIRLDQLTGEVHIRLQSDDATQPDKLLLRIMSPTVASDDEEITLLKTVAGTYAGQLGKPHSGRRYIQLETVEGAEVLAHEQSLKGWRLDREIRLEDDPAGNIHAFSLTPETHL